MGKLAQVAPDHNQLWKRSKETTKENHGPGETYLTIPPATLEGHPWTVKSVNPRIKSQPYWAGQGRAQIWLTPREFLMLPPRVYEHAVVGH